MTRRQLNVRQLNVVFSVAVSALVMVFLFAWFAEAGETIETKTFGWNAGSNWATSPPTKFKMFWNDSESGEYALMETFEASGTGGPDSFSSPLEVTVSGPPSTWVTKYFVLKACGDVQQEDGSTQEICSDPSNVLEQKFWIKFDGYSIPVRFRVIAE